MPIVQPNANARMGKRVLNNNIRRTVAIHVESRDIQRKIVRLKGEVDVATSGEMDFDAECFLSVNFSGINDQRAVRFAIHVKIGGGQALAKWLMPEPIRCRELGNRAAQTILRPKRRPCQNKQSSE